MRRMAHHTLAEHGCAGGAEVTNKPYVIQSGSTTWAGERNTVRGTIDKRRRHSRYVTQALAPMAVESGFT
jgi:hypothetical protein